MTKVTLRHAALALAAAGSLSLSAAYAQTDSPSEGQAPATTEQGQMNQGGMMSDGMGQGGMMTQMSEMMESCNRMMQTKAQDGAPQPEARPDNG